MRTLAVLKFLAPICALAAFGSAFDWPVASADSVELKSGGRIAGEIQPLPDEGATSSIAVKTLSGVMVEIDRENIREIITRPLEHEEFERKARATPETTDELWALAEWCRERRLNEPRIETLNRLLALDADHERARSALGYLREDGEWLTRDELMSRRGFILHDGKYITPQEKRLQEQIDDIRAREQAWFKDIRLWSTWLTGRDDGRRQQAYDLLTSISDPDALRALTQFLGTSEIPLSRGTYVEVLSDMSGDSVIAALVNQSLHDIDRSIRRAALAAIEPEQYPSATIFYRQALRHPTNLIIRRAGVGLGQVGDDSAIPDLIRSLVTTHRYKVRVPAQGNSYSFSTSGTFGPGGSPLPADIEVLLRTGQLQNGVIVYDPGYSQTLRWKTLTINYNHQNPEVLSALKKLTGESFGYDERTWLTWYHQ
ncbi:HEAT repeat domain-containing protein [Calycomorphotria hydatis]|nr:HEAT repeat domain-containing protein [Calycomorphotria hydatis]